MQLSIQILVGLIAVFHLYVLWVEMFAWLSRGPKVFKSIPKELFPPTKVLAANQGLYNGFLAAGLIWSLFICDPLWQNEIRLFFLSCVALAGIYGGLTAGKRIFFVQAVPALIGIGLVLFSPRYCDENCNSQDKKIVYSFIPSNDRFDTMQVSADKLLEMDNRDSLITSSYIEKDGKDSGIQLFTNRNHELAIDADLNIGYMQGIGQIYSHSITWRDFGVLHTNNDSINSLIALGLGRLIVMETESKIKMENSVK